MIFKFNVEILQSCRVATSRRVSTVTKFKKKKKKKTYSGKVFMT